MIRSSIGDIPNDFKLLRCEVVWCDRFSDTVLILSGTGVESKSHNQYVPDCINQWKADKPAMIQSEWPEKGEFQSDDEKTESQEHKHGSFPGSEDDKMML